MQGERLADRHCGVLEAVSGTSLFVGNHCTPALDPSETVTRFNVAGAFLEG